MLQRCSVYSTQSVNTGAVLAANKSAWSVVQVAVKTECFLTNQLWRHSWCRAQLEKVVCVYPRAQAVQSFELLCSPAAYH